MNLEEKKLTLIQMVIAIESEEIIDAISMQIAELVAQNQTQEQKKKEDEALRGKKKLANDFLSRYSKGLSKEKFDLEKVKQERPPKPFDATEFEKMTDALTWKEGESIEKLLNDLN